MLDRPVFTFLFTVGIVIYTSFDYNCDGISTDGPGWMSSPEYVIVLAMLFIFKES